ncbi:hypothetical protein [Fibrobacter sp. UWH9]|uniref:hypothetical protein n=1 Tax=Fibrobacter sp. UWH9 TaxID=1896213 RepID=UPI001587B710|nr:hypothetical protein [Fibrobacter sp. UWH9]
MNCALRKSKSLKISYDWRGMPVEFRMESTRVCSIGNMDAGGVNMPNGLGRYGVED